ncbi:MAG: aspartate/glutamate racemase family protein [Bacillota bacterium]
MKIRVIIPNSSRDFLESQVKQRQNAVGKEVFVDVMCLNHGPVSLESGYDEVLASPHLVNAVLKAEEDGYDAVTIDCAADPILRTLKEIVDIPVIGAGEASYLCALALCKKFSIITVLKNTVEIIKDNIDKYALGQRVASVRTANVPVLELKDHQKAFNAIKEQAIKAIQEDGAHAIVLGCTGMSSLANPLQNELKVPVIDPAVSALQLAVVMLNMNLTQSKICYCKPIDKTVL